MEYDSVQLKKLIAWDQECKLVLPNFQRRFVWDRDAQRRLAASFIVDIPIGSILIVDGLAGDFAARRLGDKEGEATPTPECRFLLDGQQRISCLKSVFSDTFFGEDTAERDARWDHLYPLLRNRWVVRITPKEGERDIFGWKMLNFDGFQTDDDRAGVEPEEMYERLTCLRVLRQAPDSWHHPEFLRDESLSSQERKQRVGERAAAEDLVPLWEVMSSEDGDQNYQYALQMMAYKRMEELRAWVGDSEDRLSEVLSHVEASIGHGQTQFGAVERAWHKLATRWAERVAKSFQGIGEHEIPTTELPSREIGRAVAIFENINKGGTPLSVFDLVVARAALSAAEKKSLRDRVTEEFASVVEIPASVRSTLEADPPASVDGAHLGLLKQGELTSTVQNQFLNVLSILSHFPDGDPEHLKVDHIKRSKILALTPEQINTNAMRAAAALTRAYAFLHFRCGVWRLSELSYDLMAVPLAFALAEDATWENVSKINKLEYWYWVSLLGGMYRDRMNEQCIQDVGLVWRWLDGEPNPFLNRRQRVLEAPDYSDLDTLLMKGPDHKVPAAVAKGIFQYVLSTQPRDLLPSETYPEGVRLAAWRVASGWEFAAADGKSDVQQLEDHHILPLAAASRLGQSSAKLRAAKDHLLNSPLNRTYISGAANGYIRAKTPLEYFAYISNLAVANHGIPTSLETYYPDEDADEAVANGKYESMLAERHKQLKARLDAELSHLT